MRGKEVRGPRKEIGPEEPWYRVTCLIFRQAGIIFLNITFRVSQMAHIASLELNVTLTLCL